MLNTKTLWQHKLSRGWWMLLVAAGVALIYFLNQTPPPSLPTADPTPVPATASTSPQTAPSPTETAADTPYLAEYNPDTNPMLESNATDKQEWELGIDVVIKLALVLALVYVAMLGLRWLKKGKTHPLTGSATINVLETTGLAPGRSLHVVVVGEKTLLLGATDTQISLLAELPDAVVPLPEETEEFNQAMTAAQTEAGAPASGAADELPPHLKPLADPALAGVPVTYELDWQSALAGMRAGIRRMQETVGG